MKIKRKKCATGTSIKGLVKNPTEALVQNNINLDKATYEAMSSPLSQALGYAAALSPIVGQIYTEDILPMIKKYNFGGTVEEQIPVEVEGEEVAKTPNGEVMEFNGPDHEQGGIEISLPEQTKIFSKRIKKFGNSMAQRAKEREQKVKSLEKKLQKNPTDILLLQTLERIKANNKILEEKDLALQEAFNNMLKTETSQEVAYGTGKKGLKKYQGGSSGVLLPEDEKVKSIKMYLPEYLQNNQDQFSITKVYNPVTTPVSYAKTEIPSFENNSTEIIGAKTSSPISFEKTIDVDNIGGSNLSEVGAKNLYGGNNSKFKIPTIGSLNIPFTTGDVVGLVGQGISTFAPYMNTLKNRSTDRVHENFMQGVGDEALKTYEDAVVSLKQNRDKALQDLELMRNTMAQRARSSARGINTSRALDLFSQQELNKKQNEINMAYANQVMEVMLGKAGMQLQTDQMQRAGAQTADTMNRRDQDIFNKNLGRDKANIGHGLQNIGKSLNEIYGTKDLARQIEIWKKQGKTAEQIQSLIDLYLIQHNSGVVQPTAEQPKQQ